MEEYGSRSELADAFGLKSKVDAWDAADIPYGGSFHAQLAVAEGALDAILVWEDARTAVYDRCTHTDT